MKNSILLNLVQAGPLLVASCYTGCNTATVACYASVPAVFGTVTFGLGTPVGILLCSAEQGLCMSACTALIIAPTP